MFIHLSLYAQGRSKEIMCLRTTAPRAASRGEVHPLLDYAHADAHGHPEEKMHKKSGIFFCDTTVIFSYVHNLSTLKKEESADKSTYTPSYPHYPQSRTGFLVENALWKSEMMFC